jgi:hypothetical protein
MKLYMILIGLVVLLVGSVSASVCSCSSSSSSCSATGCELNSDEISLFEVRGSGSYIWNDGRLSFDDESLYFTSLSDELSNINGYTFNRIPDGSVIKYNEDYLIFDVEVFESGEFLAFRNSNQDLISFISIDESDCNSNDCAFDLYLPNKDQALADKEFRYVPSKDFNVKFSVVTYDDAEFSQSFFLTANDEFVINEVTKDKVSVDVTLGDDDVSVKSPIFICGDRFKKQYNYGVYGDLIPGTDISSDEKIGLSDKTKFSFSMSPIEDGSVDSNCVLTSCEYYGNLESTGNIVLRCDLDDGYPIFDIHRIADLQGLKFEENMWTCEDSCSKALGSGIVKLYPVNNVFLTLVNNKFESYSVSNDELKAKEFYVGAESNGYLVKPNDGMASFEKVSDDELKMTLKDGGVITIPEGMLNLGYAGSEFMNKEDLILEKGHAYRIIFSLNSNQIRLFLLDCCKVGSYSGTATPELVGNNLFYSYGCELVPEESRRFLSSIISGKSKNYVPVESTKQCVVKSSQVQASSEPEAVSIGSEGFSEIIVGDVDLDEECATTDPGSERYGWGYYCGMRSGLDPCYSVVGKQVLMKDGKKTSTSSEGGLWSTDECNGLTGQKSDGTKGCDSSKNEGGFYCCDPYVAAKKPYAFKGDATTDNLGMNRYSGRHNSLDWTRVDKTSCLESVAAKSVLGYVEEGYSCNYLEWAYYCVEGIGSDWLQCLPETPGSENRIWMRAPGCREGYACNPSQLCTSSGCECVEEESLCKSGEYKCDGRRDVMQCGDDGVTWSRASVCIDPYYCDEKDCSEARNYKDCCSLEMADIGECDSSSDCESLFGEAYPCLNHECQDGARECEAEVDCDEGDLCIGGFCVDQLLAEEEDTTSTRRTTTTIEEGWCVDELDIGKVKCESERPHVCSQGINGDVFAVEADCDDGLVCNEDVCDGTSVLTDDRYDVLDLCCVIPESTRVSTTTRTRSQVSVCGDCALDGERSYYLYVNSVEGKLLISETAVSGLEGFTRVSGSPFVTSTLKTQSYCSGSWNYYCSIDSLIACTSDSDCSSGYACDTIRGICNTICQEDFMCKEGFYCNLKTWECELSLKRAPEKESWFDWFFGL